MQTHAKVIPLRQMNGLNRLATNVERVRDALTLLGRHQIDVLDIDVNRSKPVITIPEDRRNEILGKAAWYQISHDDRGRFKRFQIMVEGCRVEYNSYVN